MTILELRSFLEEALEGSYWCHLVLDEPEWTRPEYYHQN